MNPIYLKAIGIGLNVIGTIILAIRVKKILDALVSAIKFHDINIQQLVDNKDVMLNFQNSPVFVEKAQALGTKLLVLGFLFIIVGNLLNGLALFVS